MRRLTLALALKGSRGYRCDAGESARRVNIEATPIGNSRLFLVGASKLTAPRLLRPHSTPKAGKAHRSFVFVSVAEWPPRESHCVRGRGVAL
jgi:hypothetical protein